MSRLRLILLALCPILLVVMGTGCGPAAVKPPDTFPVSGVVTMKGAPVVGAVVNFATPSAPRIATATTDAEGKYQLSTFGQGDGAVAGKHQVMIVKLDPDLQQKPGEDADAFTTRVLGKDPGKSLLPSMYASSLHSPLTAEVSATGPNEFKFDLK